MMKKILSAIAVITICLLSLPAFSQNKEKVDTTQKLGLAGDGLDLYAVSDLFLKSKTIESFEKSLNDPKTKINNLDLDLDKKVDFIKVVTEKKDESYMFILRVDVSKTESQDVAVILLDKNKDKKVSMQIVGDEDLYGKDYVIEPKGNSPVTPNPAYKGEDPVTVTVEAPATTVVVQQAPVVQYVYSPAYAPYYPPYAYGYYPGWFAFTAVVSFGFYCGAWGGYHGGYYGGAYHGGNNVVINNNNNFNNYNNNSRNRATTVSDRQGRGDYGNGRTDRKAGDRASASTRESGNRAGTSDRAGASNRAGTSDRASASNRAGTSDKAGTSNRATTSDRSSSNRASTSPSTSNRSSSFNSPSTSNRSSSSYGGGGGRSMGGGSRSMGGGGGGRRR